jgi:hypothetical protein
MPLSAEAEEVILEVGVDGGSLRLVGRRRPRRWAFQARTTEQALIHDDPDLAGCRPPARPWTSSWRGALRQLAQYPWEHMYPLRVHPEFRTRIAAELYARLAARSEDPDQAWQSLLWPEPADDRVFGESKFDTGMREPFVPGPQPKQGFICPKCAARSGVDIVYGMPSPDVFERAKRGELAIGGCVIEEFTPERQCLACGYEWRIRRKQSARSTDPDDEDGTAGRR